VKVKEMINGISTLDVYPKYVDRGQDYTQEWANLLQGNEEDFPAEASFANHYFYWEHEINGKKREQFDCTDFNSFKLIPPQDYLKAYRKAKAEGEI
jgi:type I site-specific restriction endonuclease